MLIMVQSTDSLIISQCLSIVRLMQISITHPYKKFRFKYGTVAEIKDKIKLSQYIF